MFMIYNNPPPNKLGLKFVLLLFIILPEEIFSGNPFRLRRELQSFIRVDFSRNLFKKYFAKEYSKGVSPVG